MHNNLFNLKIIELKRMWIMPACWMCVEMYSDPCIKFAHKSAKQHLFHTLEVEPPPWLQLLVLHHSVASQFVSIFIHRFQEVHLWCCLHETSISKDTTPPSHSVTLGCVERDIAKGTSFKILGGVWWLDRRHAAFHWCGCIVHEERWW